MIAVWIIVALQIVGGIVAIAGIIYLAFRRRKISKKENFEKRGS
jgi:hypothetical protein